MKLADILKQLRTEAKLSVKDAAERSGVSASYWYDLERGYRDEVTLGVAVRIADALGVEVARLIPQDDLVPSH